MKKVYSTIMMLAMMVAALSFTACGSSSDDDEIDGGDDENEYFQISINGEAIDNVRWGGGSWFAYYEPISKNGMDVYFYGGMSGQIMISEYDAMECNIFAGYITEDLETLFPKSEGTYEIVCENGKYNTAYGDNIGMVLTGGNMNRRTVTSGSLKITKVSKVQSLTAKYLYGRDYAYATEGTFSFTLTDNWDGNENKISGKFRLVF